jgi:hypothetical protein
MDSTSVIASLENAPQLIIPLVREVPAANLKRRPQPGKWSAHEHACHLADVHPRFFGRLDQFLKEAHPYIVPFDPASDMPEDALLGVDLDEALDRFVRERAVLVQRLRDLSDTDWERTADHGEYSHYSVFIMCRHLAMHDMTHAYRIEELLLKKEWA